MSTPRSVTSHAVGFFSISAAFAILGGCSSGGSGTAPAPMTPAVRSAQHAVMPGALLAMHAPAGVRPDRSPSWMDRNASSGALLYISDYGSGRVNIYSYPQGKLVGSLSGFEQPQGVCSDAAGNVWIANTGTSEIVEFAHGGTVPIGALENPGQNPADCSVNPKNGDLAVSSITTTTGGKGTVTIFNVTDGTSKTIGAKAFQSMYFLGYDNQGNLFVDGLHTGTLVFYYAEVRSGHATFEDINLRGATFRFPGGVQFDGTSMAVGDQAGAAIYQTSGATITGTTRLTGACDVGEFVIHVAKVVAPNLCPSAGGNVLFYKYPAGGSSTKNFRKLAYPIGATISQAP